MSETRTFDDDAADRTRDHAPTPTAAPKPPLTTAQALAPPGYAIVGELGRGGMGVVYDAVQTSLNRPCALKMVLGSGHAGSVALIRFLAEAEAVAAIDHPHVVRVFEFGNHGGHPFLAMERLDGGSLADRLKATGPLPVADAVGLLERIASGVQAGHDLGIVHRDLKPGNILLTSDGTPKVTDFGLAKRDSGSDLTSTNAMMGTPEYMSPEQAKGQTKFVGPTADVYALGAMLYATLSGRPPFQCPSLFELRLKVINEDAPTLTKFAPAVPRDLAIIAAKCLAKDPAERYPSAAAFADDLRRWRSGGTIVARAAGSRERAWKAAKRNRGLVAAVGVVVLALCVGMAATSVAAVQALAEAKRADAETAKARDEAARADGETAKALAQAERADKEAAKAVKSAKRTDEEVLRAREEAKRADKAATTARTATDRAETQLSRAERLYYLSLINQADRAYRTGSISGAIDCLNSTSWNMRGWEHDYLTSKLHAGHVSFLGHTGGVNAVAFSPDGNSLASASSDHTVKLWDAKTGSSQKTLLGHTGVVLGIAFSPDGNTIASASKDGTVKLWDTATGRLRKTLAGHEKYVTSIAFSPDGETVASASGDQTVKIWDVVTGVMKKNIIVRGLVVLSVAFNPNGDRLVTSSLADGAIKLWASVDGAEMQVVSGHTRCVNKVAYSRSGLRMASAGGDCIVKLWDAVTGIEERSLVGHTAEVKDVVFCPDGTKIASASSDGTIKIWDAATGLNRCTLTGHLSVVNGLAFSPDGTRIASAGDDGTLRLWDNNEHCREVKLVATPKVYDGYALDKSGTLSARGLPNSHNIEISETTTGRIVQSMSGHTTWITALAFNCDGTRIASASTDSSVRIWRIGSESAIMKLNTNEKSISCIAFSTDGNTLATSGHTGIVKIWSMATGQELRRLTGLTTGVMSSVVSLAFSMDDTRMVSARNDGNIKLWHIASGHEVLNWDYKPDKQFPSNTYDVKFDAHGNISSYGNGSSVLLLNTLPRFPDATLEVRSASYYDKIINNFAITKLGSQLVTRVGVGDLATWSLTTGQLLEDEPVPPDLTFVTRADLPDGKREVFIEGGKVIVRDKAKYAAFQAEMARRLAEYAKPKPEWHARSFDEAAAAKDWFAARFHLGYLRKIKGDADLSVRWRAAKVPAP